MNRFVLLFALASLGPGSPIGTLAQTPPAAPTNAASAKSGGSSMEQARQLSVATKPWKGDFDAMLERRVIRIYVPYSRSLYFIDKGRERGIAADLIREFERWVNKKYAKTLGKRPLTVFVVVATRDKLLADLTEGHADIAVGNIKVLDELLKSVDFVAPDENVASTEILVTGPASPAIASIDDLSGKTVHVREYSSYYLSLTALNERFKKAGKPPVKLVPVPNALEDEDMLEMLNAGLLEAIVVDDWKAKMWAQVLPKVKIHEDIQLRPKTKLGWAIRKGSPKLAAELNEFHAYFAKKQGGIPALQRQYMKTIKALNNAASAEDRKRFQELIDYFQKYGQQYHFDPLMLAAQGYQESTLQPGREEPGRRDRGHAGHARDRRGTQGGRHPPGRAEHTCRREVHGSAHDEVLRVTQSSTNRTGRCLPLRATTRGPGNISKMRKEAAKRGLDPDQWFNNVEIVTAEKIGIETTTYVRNIFKYYAAYKLVTEAQATAATLKEQVAPAKK